MPDAKWVRSKLFAELVQHCKQCLCQSVVVEEWRSSPDEDSGVLPIREVCLSCLQLSYMAPTSDTFIEKERWRG